MLKTEITYCGESLICACDGLCEKAWGLNNRKHESLSKDDSDIVWLADIELGTAPINPGTSEGGQLKPLWHPTKHNKWCVRECERSELFEPGVAIVLPDWSKRVYNMKQPLGESVCPKEPVTP